MITNHDDIADAIRGKLKEATGLVTGADVLDTCNPLELPHDMLDVNGWIKIDSSKRAKGTVMHDIGVGNRENDPYLISSAPIAEKLAQINDLWLPQRVIFVVHAVVCSNAYDGSACVKCAKVLVETLMKAVGFCRSRRVFMLNIVSQGEVHQRWLIALEHAESGFQDKFTQLTRIDFRGVPPDQRIDIVDAMLPFLGFMRLFR